MILTGSRAGGVPKWFYFRNKRGTKRNRTGTETRSVNNMWIIISIILAINSMWLLKLNKDLIDRNDELIATIVINSINQSEGKNND